MEEEIRRKVAKQFMLLPIEESHKKFVRLSLQRSWCKWWEFERKKQLDSKLRTMRDLFTGYYYDKLEQLYPPHTQTQ